MKLRHGTDTFLSTSLFEILKYMYEICYIYKTEYSGTHTHSVNVKGPVYYPSPEIKHICVLCICVP